MNNIEKYYEAITTGKIITSQRIIKTYERIIKGIKDEKVLIFLTRKKVKDR